MNRVELLAHQLHISYGKEEWFPPLEHALAGLTAAQASWRPAGEAGNTIWQTLSHLLYYKERLLERLQGGTPVYPYKENDETFNEVGAPDDEAAWQATVARVAAVNDGMRAFLTAQADEAFDHAPSGKRPLGLVMSDIILHDVYHTGQIVQIRKLQGSWPSSRS